VAARLAENADTWPTATPLDTSGPPDAALGVALGLVAHHGQQDG
jgi:hypothetical protein